ncbi:PREDICTED: probable methyltransferase BTM2 homolog [Papilio xuthus]|uniref:S-adenosylmethionine sensor upstream of mTORC1 n=1 Tax=Papilio xuthus TaxID=66420 RepID=A0AAJ6Z5U1_PAPXU|nr:PREDICTED: probable methyltransferase BTM2 homolog [Papilio xuthus]
MATEEHKELAYYIKEVHASLRKSSSKIGFRRAWLEHSKNEDILKKYAKCMERLATVHWDSNCLDKSNAVVSRIQWSADFSYNYYINDHYLKFRDRDIDISNKINISIDSLEQFSLPLKLLDVGSCYNPFKMYTFLDVLPIDLCPANNSVYQFDFLNVDIGEEMVIESQSIKELEQNSFDIVTFCFLLEYIPNSELRIEACVRAYNLLKPGGILIINTPDSKHVGANSKLMKCWRYTLACLGFSRIKYEKFKHMHCLVFRKSLHKDIAIRWSTLCKESNMEYGLFIPQDFLSDKEEDDHTNIDKASNICNNDSATITEHFEELPFSYDE